MMCSNQINLANLSSGCSSRDNHSSSDDESDTDDETATRDLNSWRTAVNNATSAAQLSIYVTQLVRCIAWEKSIMKVVSCLRALLHFAHFRTVLCTLQFEYCLQVQDEDSLKSILHSDDDTFKEYVETRMAFSGVRASNKAADVSKLLLVAFVVFSHFQFFLVEYILYFWFLVFFLLFCCSMVASSCRVWWCLLT